MNTEYLSVVDGNDVVIGFSTKEDIKRRGLNYRCVQVFLFNSKKEILLCKRPAEKTRYAGQFAVVMGHVRRGENYSESAIREVKEELGVNINLRRVTKFSLLDGASRVFQEIYTGVLNEEVKIDKTEISEVRAVSLKELRTEIVTNQSRFALPFIEAVRAYTKALNRY